MPVPRGQNDWSGSAHCFDQGFVVKTGTSLGGIVATSFSTGNLLANFCSGTVLIDTWGRKPVMVLGLLSLGLMAGMYAFSCSQTFSAQRIIVCVVAFVAAFFNTFEAASGAMAADKSEADDVRRSVAMTLIKNIYTYIYI